MSERELPGLWRNADFVHLWSAATITNFGSMIRRIALPFVAILELDATPADIATLAAASLLPGFLLGLFASARIDRMRKLPLLIASDLLRAALLVTVPLAAWWDLLGMEHLYAVALLSGFLSFVFDVAHTSYLPSLVERRELVSANSRLKAAEAVTEAGAFATGGWLVQGLGAPIALLVDSVSAAFSFQVYSVAYLLFANRELGFQPSTLGSIFAIGAGSSLAGALVARRAMLRLGLGHAMWGGLALVAVTMGLLPFAPGAAWGCSSWRSTSSVTASRSCSR